jgi:YebC/PmpR family DNA-binding regulatory protein
MAGHNKWSKVKHIKAVVDVKRGKIFSKFSKEITIAAKLGGGSPDANARLRSAILAARGANMPNDNIDRAIKKGTGELAGGDLAEVVYEGYGPGGAAFLVDVATDNRNRSAQDMRVLFSKKGGSIADSGSVLYQFLRCGALELRGVKLGEDELMEKMLESGADDMSRDGDEAWIVYCASDQLYSVGQQLKNFGLSVESQKLIYRVEQPIVIEAMEIAEVLMELYDALDDYDDTLNVFTNFEFSAELLEKINLN